jgi:C_GCAxxG_C_C family probable redox protein
MSEKQDEAARLYNAGCNCCQAVAGAMGVHYGLPLEDCLRLGAAFGRGMQNGEVCGAATGGLLVLGLRHGATAPEQSDKKAETNDKTAEFMQAFQQRFGSYLCRELLKAEGKKICGPAIAGAVEILEKAGV